MCSIPAWRRPGSHLAVAPRAIPHPGGANASTTLSYFPVRGGLCGACARRAGTAGDPDGNGNRPADRRAPCRRAGLHRRTQHRRPHPAERALPHGGRARRHARGHGAAHRLHLLDHRGHGGGRRDHPAGLSAHRRGARARRDHRDRDAGGHAAARDRQRGGHAGSVAGDPGSRGPQHAGPADRPDPRSAVRQGRRERRDRVGDRGPGHRELQSGLQSPHLRGRRPREQQLAGRTRSGE